MASYKFRPASQYSGGSVEESVAGMAKTGAPRSPMGNGVPLSANNASAAVTTSTRPRNYGGGQDPTIMDSPNRRSAVAGECLGASCRINAWVQPPMMHEASAMRAGGRLLPSTTVRSGFKGSSGGY